MIEKKPGGEALYLQIAQSIRNDLASFRFGEKLPTENELMQNYNASRGTIRQALRLLEMADEIYRVQGIGTFKGQGVPDVSALNKIPTLTNSLTRKVKDSTISDIKLEETITSGEVCKWLECEEGVPVWRLSRIRGTSKKPKMAYAVGYILKETIPNLKKEDLELSIISMICIKFGIRFSHSINTIKIAYPDADLCNKFGVEKDHPVLYTRLVAYNMEGNAFFADSAYNFDSDYEYIINCEYDWREV